MMRKTFVGWGAVALLIAAVPVWAHCGFCGKGETAGHDHEHGPAEVGKAAPDFTLKDLEGKEHKLSDLKGKIVVLEWTNHTCPFVKRHQGEKKTMQKTSDKFKEDEVVWLAIDSSRFCEDKADGIRDWVRKNDIKYPILLDAAGEVGHHYGAKTTPHMFVIDKSGVLAYSGAIDDDARGNKENSRNYVEEAVSALLKGSAVSVSSTKSYGCGVKYKS